MLSTRWIKAKLDHSIWDLSATGMSPSSCTTMSNVMVVITSRWMKVCLSSLFKWLMMTSHRNERKQRSPNISLVNMKAFIWTNSLRVKSTSKKSNLDHVKVKMTFCPSNSPKNNNLNLEAHCSAKFNYCATKKIHWMMSWRVARRRSLRCRTTWSSWNSSYAWVQAGRRFPKLNMAREGDQVPFEWQRAVQLGWIRLAYQYGSSRFKSNQKRLKRVKTLIRFNCSSAVRLSYAKRRVPPV